MNTFNIFCGLMRTSYSEKAEMAEYDHYPYSGLKYEKLFSNFDCGSCHVLTYSLAPSTGVR